MFHDIFPPLIHPLSVRQRTAVNLVCDGVQLNDASRSGSGLLADNVKHFAHQFLNRDTQYTFAFYETGEFQQCRRAVKERQPHGKKRHFI